MTSSPARGNTTSSSSLSGRSLLARLKSPLQSKTRNFADFYIQPDDPHRQYAPGDIISGSVVIKVLKPLRITHLVISLHGYAQVFKNPNSPGDAYRNYSSTVGSGKGKKGGSYFGNGFASLFEDEAVLCGEGRLGEGVYHFNFELEFPTKGLPSSIDFERGTISYMLTSTLTRPTTISPTTSCDYKVYLMDTIDVASITEPKPRIISLEPIRRRARTKSSALKRPSTITENKESTNSSESTRNGRISELNSVIEESDGPGSPAPSDASFESQFSSGNASGTEYGIRSVNTTIDGGSSPSGSRSTCKGKTITATIDVLKGGFLRGDQIPIKISVSHTKHVRSLKGIIITLYRQARVDMHPALPVLPNSKGDKMKSEDYYPKSKTGLGGLSLSSAGSSHLFRKDLSQSFAPLFVDPRTLTAEIKCAVRVPDEAFPTISNVPGAMISFKYFIEVVVDIQGKLQGLDRMISSAGLGGPAPTVGGERAEDGKVGMYSTWGGNFVDTDSIRREKSVISCIFEAIIGTKDSERNGKQKQIPQDAAFDAQSGVHDIPLNPDEDQYATGGVDDPGYYYGYDQDGQYYDHYAYDESYQGGFYNRPGYQETDSLQPTYQQPPYQPPPPPPEGSGHEEDLSEKERIRRAEARLLPSRPPEAAGPSSPPGAQQSILPSAPVLPEDDDIQTPYFRPGPSSSQPPPFTSVSSSASHPPPFSAAISHSSPTTAASIQRRITDDESRTVTTSSSLTINATRTQSPGASTSSASHGPNGTNTTAQASPQPAAPQYSASSSYVEPTDDKHELQRRRLEMERSAPPTNPEEEAAGPSAPPTTDINNLTLAPSAPTLDDDDEGLVGAVRPGRSGNETNNNNNNNNETNEALPVYRR